MTTLVEESNRIEEEGSHVMAILDQTGDTRIVWDPDDPVSVETARSAFEEEKAKGRRAFSVKRNGGKGEQIRTFDPELEKMILAPALVGG